MTCSDAVGTFQSHSDECTCQSHSDEGTCQSHSDSQENENRLDASEPDHETSLVPNAHQGSQFSIFLFAKSVWLTKLHHQLNLSCTGQFVIFVKNHTILFVFLPDAIVPMQ